MWWRPTRATSLRRRSFSSATPCVPGVGPDFKDIPLATLGVAPALATARLVAEADYDALIDLGGMIEATAPFLAARPARTVWTYRGASRRACGSADHARAARHRRQQGRTGGRTNTDRQPGRGMDRAPPRDRGALREAMAVNAPATPATSTASEMSSLWRAAVAAHQASDADAAIARYAAVLAEQPDFAPALYLKGLILRDRGHDAESRALAFGGARRCAGVRRRARRAGESASARRGPRDPRARLPARSRLATSAQSRLALRRALGSVELARHDGAEARAAFEEC